MKKLLHNYTLSTELLDTPSNKSFDSREPQYTLDCSAEGATPRRSAGVSADLLGVSKVWL